jgi:hypothetical protein
MITAIDDTVKGITLGEADGPMRFIPQFGFEVPTYVNPRNDLVPKHALGKFKRLDFHVPFRYRGNFKPEQWPKEFRQHVSYRTDTAGYVMCEATSQSGETCKARAVSRMQTCRNHGALHPADKKISGSTMTGESGMPLDRLAKLDRVQLFMQGMIAPEDLDDDEVKGRFVRDSNGIPVKTVKLGMKFEAILHKELLRRMNEYLQTKAPRAIEVMYEIADSDVYEAADRIKSAQWLAERVIGKTPDVLVNVDAKETPFQSILSGIDSGSREDYRKSVNSQREIVREEDNYIDAEIDECDDGHFVEDSSVLDEEDSDSDSIVDVIDEIAEQRENKKQQLKEARDRIKKAKSRRYAARATGANSLEGVPFLLQFKETKEGMRMKLIPSSTASPAQVDRLVAGS